MKRLIPLRIYLVAETLFSVSVSFFADEARAYTLLRSGGSSAEFLTSLILVLSLLAGLDVYLSESDNKARAWFRRRRWWLWMALALGHAAHAGVAAINGFMPWLAANYFLHAAGCAAIAIFDIKYRGEEEKERLRATGCDRFDSKPMERTWLA